MTHSVSADASADGPSLDAALAGRYGAAGIPDAAVRSNPTIAALLAHKTTRAFLPTPLEPGTLETLVAAAQSAATSSNLQSWSVLAVEDPARKARLAHYARDQKHVEEAPLLLVFLADLARLERIGAARGRPTGGLDFLEMFVVAVADAALAAQNAVVALESLGLGACYIGSIRNHTAEVAAELGLPPNVMAVFGLAVGHPDPARASDVKPRLPQSVVLHRERYHAPEPEAVATYDAALAAFQRAQHMPETGWSEMALGRVRDAQALSGRDRLHEVLVGLGFGLK